MKVLCDYHHGDLYYSLQLLFEKRLGFEMYRPIGLDWYHQGFWDVFPHIDTANQYLALDQAINPPKDIHGDYLEPRSILNSNYRYEDGIYYVTDPTKGKVQRAITLEKFKSMDFDIVISSMPNHINPFNKLISLYQPRAKHIFQVGNVWQSLPGVKNILASTSPGSVTQPGINTVYYHQEFDLDVFRYTDPQDHTTVHSYIHYMKEEHLLGQYKLFLDDRTFKTYGAGMDECLQKSSDIAEAFSRAGWTWHVKPGGDGYGHILHNSFACGRPLIVKKDHYRGQLGEALMEDMVTCIDISRRSVHEAASIINQMSMPENHRRMCQNTYRRFREVVDFNEEEQQIRKFIGDLK